MQLIFNIALFSEEIIEKLLSECQKLHLKRQLRHYNAKFIIRNTSMLVPHYFCLCSSKQNINFCQVHLSLQQIILCIEELVSADKRDEKTANASKRICSRITRVFT